MFSSKILLSLALFVSFAVAAPVAAVERDGGGQPTYYIKGDHIERGQSGSKDYRRDGGGSPDYWIKGDHVERDQGGGAKGY
ncbi:hypothetical protein FIBSPDRAFT_944270 [Athelia psychrophila]|uniref:Uncharacterized protein n=1 Tax=Athelia psychrophila TaxID=1759441 RepID=A0A166UZP7_9AGAM|nr:hypothetical protein FIBSPDRAFT_944270 [Fibularhizoctonia sp. CBS 109695]